MSSDTYWVIIIIIIIITIWHYNPLWVFACSAKSVKILPSVLSCLLSVFYFQLFFRSSMTSFCHRCLGLPTGLVPIGFQSNSFLVGLAWSIIWIWPNNLILCALMNLTISAPSINLSISMLFQILHILSVLTWPYIFLSVCLSKMRKLFSSFVTYCIVWDWNGIASTDHCSTWMADGPSKKGPRNVIWLARQQHRSELFVPVRNFKTRLLFSWT